MSERPLLLLDTATLYYRAFHALPATITAPDGTPSGAVRGTLDFLSLLLAHRRPGQVVACWDEDWRPAWRTELLPSYKAHRAREDGSEDAPAALGAQVDGLVDLLAALGVPRRGAPGAEADDVAATLAARAARTGRVVEVVSGDRDLFQVVDDGDMDGEDGGSGDSGGSARGPVRVVWIGRGVKDAQVMDGAALSARCSLRGAALRRTDGVGAAYADLAVLRGDPSDGLAGVAGIGEKTAAALLERFGDLAAVLAAAADPAGGLTPAQRRYLAAAGAYLERAPRVVAVRRDVDVDLPTAPAGLRAGVDDQGLAAAAQRWGVAGPVERLLAAMETADAG